MSSNTPTKRKRTADTVAEAKGPIVQSTLFWFDDGNVILQSENTQFRVHRSILATHSPILKDLFSFQPDDEPAVDGCPAVVHMLDSAKDINNLCAILYGMYHIDVDGIDGSFLTTMLRMGHTYKIAFFKTSARNCLRPLFPNTLHEWDDAQGKVRDIISKDKGFLFDVINGAHESDFAAILPAAFLSLYVLYGLDDILTGVMIPAKIYEQPIARLKPPALRDSLCGRMTFMAPFFQGVIRYLESDKLDVLGRIEYSIPTSDCKSFYCKGRVPNILALLIKMSIDKNPVILPRDRNTALDLSLVHNHPLCESCRGELMSIFNRCRADMWDKLPMCVNLPTWEMIKESDV